MPRKSITDMIPDIDAPETRPGLPAPEAPESPAQAKQGAATPGPRRQRAPRSRTAIPRAQDPAPPPPDTELDADTLGRWRWQLGATARKAAAAQSRAAAASAAWERLVADAVAAGVPGRLVVAAAADAGMDAPGAS